MTRKRSPKRKPVRKSSPSPKKASANRERIYRVVMVLIPVLFFVGLELFLRAIGYGVDLGIFKTFKAAPTHYIINPELGKRYFPNLKVQPGIAETDAIIKIRPPNNYRIFVLGGSTAAGYPYMYNGSFSSILKVILREYYPDRHIEVLNLAMPAVSSYAVRDLARSIDDFTKPELALIYAGHNEFYGALAVASVESIGRSRTLVNLYLSLLHYKTFQLLSDGIAAVRKWIGSVQDVEEAPATLMERLARDRHVAYGSPLYHQALEIYRQNLIDAIRFCREKGIRVMLATVVSNVHDQPPFVDVFSDTTRREEWQQHFRMAQQHVQARDYQAALHALVRCQEIDSLPASQYYLQGKIYEARGDTLAAYRAFYRAKDFDGLRFRASEDLNRIIREVGTAEGVPVVPVKEAFEAHSPGHLPGNNLMLEHLHPNLEGYILMAETFAREIIERRWIGEPRAPALPDSVWRSKVAVTPVDLAAARIRIAYLMSGWPFRDGSPPPPEAFTLPNPTEEERLALRFWHNQITWEQMHVFAAQYYINQEQWDKAEQECRALILATPTNPSPYELLSRILVRRQKYEQAIAALQEWLKMENLMGHYIVSQYAYKAIGSMYVHLKRPREAIPYLQRAVELSPNDVASRFTLAQAYALAEEYRQALSLVQEVLRAKPNHPGAAELAAYIRAHLQQRSPQKTP
ncbi:MAG: hypothetical protein D6681_13605 [Calditrichaeota bacterium]|nr:MAG: hypothetical protein D6681_13605 [Calditrichota bacterium]